MISPSSPEDVVRRLEAVDRVLADPPLVHYMSSEDVEAGKISGVWSTHQSCYRYLAEHCRPGDRTLETGVGISTVLFAAWETVHTCVGPGHHEIEAVKAYCRDHDIPTNSLTFVAEPSDRGLPGLPADAPPFDLVLIDGCHGFPAPILDWYYGAGRLRQGGIAIIDDLQLPAVELLYRFLSLDPRWKELTASAKWIAFQRESGGSLGEDWFTQPFYSSPRLKEMIKERVAARMRGGLDRANQRLSNR